MQAPGGACKEMLRKSGKGHEIVEDTRKEFIGRELELVGKEDGI